MGQSITYSGPNSAWLLSTNIASQLARAVMTKITNNENVGGTRLIRGYTEVEKWKKRNEEANKNKFSTKKEESDSPTASRSGSRSIDSQTEGLSKIPEKSNTEFTINNYTINDEKAVDHRYDKIEHLIFVVHGIGEKFAEEKASSTIESSVNDIRKTAKEVAKLYFCKDKKQHQRGTVLPSFETTSENAYKNIYVPEGTGVQFIPVNWRRHMNIDKYKVKRKKHRSRQGLKKSISNTIGKSKEEENKKENTKNESNDNLKAKSTDYLKPESISTSNSNLKPESASASDIDDDYDDDDDDDEFDFPKMNDILLESIPAVRTIVTDLALDVLYYMVPRFYQQMITILSDEINRLYKLFKKHHPDFNGKVSLFGHSLGSQLCFDILCHQIPECLKDENNNVDTIKYTRTSAYGSENSYNYKQLDFPVHTFFAVGSPIGLFTILSDRNIRFFDWKHPSMKGLTNNDTLVPIVKKMYNIFHPSDPVAHRIEPLILKKKDYIKEEGEILKPNPVPYSKGGLTGTVREFQGYQKDFALRSMKLFGGVYNAVQAFIDPKSESREIKDDDDVEEKFDARNIRHINPHGRLDYVIQADILDNQYLAAIPAHSSYWNDKDTISFVLAELYRDMKFD